MIEKQKLEKLHRMCESLDGSAGDDKRLKNCAKIFQILLTHIDDLQEECMFLKEENESLRFDLEDKKYEEGPRRRTRRETMARAIPARNIWIGDDDEVPF